MSYNIRNVEGGNHAGTNDLTFEYDGRDQAVVDYILSEMPDVLGLQEASVKSVKKLWGNEVIGTLSWFDTLEQLEAAGYAYYKGENVLASYGGNKEIGGINKLTLPAYLLKDFEEGDTEKWQKKQNPLRLP